MRRRLRDRPLPPGRRVRVWARIVGAAALLSVALTSAAAAPPRSMPAYDVLKPPGPSPTSGLRATFMGTSTLLIQDDETQILIDGFFTRPGFWTMALGQMRPDEKRIDDGLRAGGVDGQRLAAVLVAHAHHDHALDAPDVAHKRPGSSTRPVELVGSESLANIVLGRFPDAPRPIVRPAPTRTPYTYGAFKVSAFQTRHSPTPLRNAQADKPLARDAYILSYRMGPNYAFVIDHGDVRILVYPSAYPPEGQERALVQGLQPDVVFLGVGKLGDRGQAAVDFTERYWREVVLDSRASLVIPIHWDDFKQPFEFSDPPDAASPLKAQPKPLGWPLDNARKGLHRVMGLACRDRVEMAWVPLFVPIAIDGRDRLPADRAERRISAQMAQACAAPAGR